jgi:hypothetical protein
MAAMDSSGVDVVRSAGSGEGAHPWHSTHKLQTCPKLAGTDHEIGRRDRCQNGIPASEGVVLHLMS